jgi:nifR3 family TIM-barrel protein
MAPLKIGNLELATPLLLAPIAGYCDLAFRLVARSCGGVGLACTDLLSPEGLLRATPQSLRLAQTTEADSPLCMQLYGGEADRLCDAARWAEDRGAHVIDINMGCPVDKVTKRDGGSKLLCDPDRTLRIVERIRGVLRHTPLTAKLRLGWDDSCLVAPRLARRLEEAGVALITIHGRTTEMKFSGRARLDGIAEVVAAVRGIPVIGNGDIRTVADARHMFEVTKCAGVMIGRGALSMPWIFRDIWSELSTGVIPPAPTLEEKCQLMRDHFDHICRLQSERIAVCEFRKRVSWYAKQMNPCPMLREGMRVMETAGDFERVIAEFLEWRASLDQDTERGNTCAEELVEAA